MTVISAAYDNQIVVLDPWAYFSYKWAQAGQIRTPSVSAPDWVGEDHKRRLQAYRLLEGYYRNTARSWLPADVDLIERAQRREYGDAHLIVEAVRSSVLGDSQTIQIPDALGDKANSNAKDALNKLNEWSKAERFTTKMVEAERNACKLGDGVYVLGWDAKKKRPRLQVYDPGFYFPVLEDEEGDVGDVGDITDDYPKKVHIAWEYETRKSDETICYIRRITYELREDDAPHRYKWNSEATNTQCYMHDEIFEKSRITSNGTIYSVGDLQRPTQTLTPPGGQPLDIDFIPVVHVPNTVAESDHYGESTIASVIQIFDDIGSTDTDLQKASATTGSPVIGIGGNGILPTDSDGAMMSYGPGQILETGDGKLDMLDTSRSLDALIKYKEELLKRLSVNARTPETLLGRVEPHKVNSGVILTLSFTPHINLIREMRLVREEKYALLLKFVQRFMVGNGLLDEVYDAAIAFGSYVPNDRQETSGIVVNLLTNHAISIETGVAMLVESGFPIEDAVEEITRIVEQNFDAADKLLTATGDIDAVRKRLGMGPAPDNLLAAATGNTPSPNGTGEGQPQNPPAQQAPQNAPGGRQPAGTPGQTPARTPGPLA